VRSSATIAAILATGQAQVVDLVTLSIPRRWYTFPGGAAVDAPAVVRWTSHSRSLRYGGNVFQGLAGAVWSRGGRNDQVGAEVAQLSCSLAGTVLVPWRTDPANPSTVDQIPLSDLAVLGLLEGATLQIDEAVATTWPVAPAGEAAAALSIDQVLDKRVLAEVVRAHRAEGMAVRMEARSLLHRGGESLPRSVLAPTCRWEFGGAECGVTGIWSSVLVLEADDDAVEVNSTVRRDYGSVVPLFGRNLGIRRAFGAGVVGGGSVIYSLPEPWPWDLADGTPLAVSVQCSKMANQSLAGRDSCEGFGNLARFAGFPGMPSPESA
jgi:hypothetical protein